MLTPSEIEISLVLSGIVNHKNHQAPDPPFLEIIREFVISFKTYLRGVRLGITLPHQLLSNCAWGEANPADTHPKFTVPAAPSVSGLRLPPSVPTADCGCFAGRGAHRNHLGPSLMTLS